MTLLKKYRYALKDPETAILPKRICHADKMIEMLKGNSVNQRFSVILLISCLLISVEN